MLNQVLFLGLVVGVLVIGILLGKKTSKSKNDKKRTTIKEKKFFIAGIILAVIVLVIVVSNILNIKLNLSIFNFSKEKEMVCDYIQHEPTFYRDVIYFKYDNEGKVLSINSRTRVNGLNNMYAYYDNLKKLTNFLNDQEGVNISVQYDENEEVISHYEIDILIAPNAYKNLMPSFLRKEQISIDKDTLIDEVKLIFERNDFNCSK